VEGGCCRAALLAANRAPLVKTTVLFDVSGVNKPSSHARDKESTHLSRLQGACREDPAAQPRTSQSRSRG
jgi:hypothetical protein